MKRQKRDDGVDSIGQTEAAVGLEGCCLVPDGEGDSWPQDEGHRSYKAPQAGTLSHHDQNCEEQQGEGGYVVQCSCDCRVYLAAGVAGKQSQTAALPQRRGPGIGAQLRGSVSRREVAGSRRRVRERRCPADVQLLGARTGSRVTAGAGLCAAMTGAETATTSRTPIAISGIQGTSRAMDIGGTGGLVAFPGLAHRPPVDRAATLYSSRRTRKPATRPRPRTIAAIPAATTATAWSTG